MKPSAPPYAGKISSVASSGTDVTILAQNDNRNGATIYNESTAILYLALSNVTADSTHYTTQVAAGGLFVLEPGDYTGIIKGYWASVNGSARVTEFA